MRQLAILGSILLLSASLFGGSFKAYLKKDVVEKGESAELVFEVKGKKMTFPQITNIAGFKTQSYTQSFYTSINGKSESGKKIGFMFFPTHDINISTFSVNIDGETFNTKPLSLKVVPSTLSKHFSFTVSLDKDEVYVGESVNVTFVFTRDMREMVRDLSFNPPTFDKLWLEQSERHQEKTQGTTQTQTLRYKVTPQSSGEFVFDNSFVELVLIEDIQDDFGFIREKNNFKRVYAKAVTLKVKALPEGIDVAGDFSLDVQVDKTSVAYGEAVNMRVVIKGEGNIDDIVPFEKHIQGVSVIEDSPAVDKKQGTFVQKIAFVGEKSFTIEPIVFRYFDIKTKTIKVLTSPSFPITVSQKKEVIKSQLQTKHITTPQPVLEKTSWIFVSLGTLVGVLIGFMLGRFKRWGKKEEQPLEKRIKKANDKALLDMLLPYVGKSTDLDKVIYHIEENVFNRGTHEIDKTWIIKELDEKKF